MLVLERKSGQEIVIGKQVIVKVIAVQGGRIRLGILAPANVSIRRAELLSANRPSTPVESSV